MNDKPIGTRSYGAGFGQIPTLEQHNYQVEMDRRQRREPAGVLCIRREPAGVLCKCGTEMVYEIGNNPWYNISHGNPNHLSPGQPVNVQCPSCGKTGWKE